VVAAGPIFGMPNGKLVAVPQLIAGGDHQDCGLDGPFAGRCQLLIERLALFESMSRRDVDRPRSYVWSSPPRCGCGGNAPPGSGGGDAGHAQRGDREGRPQESTVAADRDTPLMYVLSNELGLQGPRFGCGLAQCGSCSVLLDGVEIRSCITPVAAVEGKSVTTPEGLPGLYARQRNLANAPALHPLQRAMIDEQAPQCGYCYGA